MGIVTFRFAQPCLRMCMAVRCSIPGTLQVNCNHDTLTTPHTTQGPKHGIGTSPALLPVVHTAQQGIRGPGRGGDGARAVPADGL